MILKGFNFGHIQTASYLALDNCSLFENYSKYFDDFTGWLLGERLLPFGLLVSRLNSRPELTDACRSGYYLDGH